MDAPVEELGAPAEPLGPSGAPDLRTATHPGQSQEAAAEKWAAGGPTCWRRPDGANSVLRTRR